MKESKKELEKAIITVGKSLEMEKSIELLLVNIGVYSTIKELTYQMFVQNKQQYFEKDDDVFEAISLIREYSKEMSKNGEVNFDVGDSYSNVAKAISKFGANEEESQRNIKIMKAKQIELKLKK